MVEHSYIFRDIAMVFAAALVCGLKAGLISPALYHATLAASLITILANATIFRILKPVAGSQPAAADSAESPVPA